MCYMCKNRISNIRETKFKYANAKGISATFYAKQEKHFCARGLQRIYFGNTQYPIPPNPPTLKPKFQILSQPILHRKHNQKTNTNTRNPNINVHTLKQQIQILKKNIQNKKYKILACCVSQDIGIRCGIQRCGRLWGKGKGNGGSVIGLKDAWPD